MENIQTNTMSQTLNCLKENVPLIEKVTTNPESSLQEPYTNSGDNNLKNKHDSNESCDVKTISCESSSKLSTEEQIAERTIRKRKILAELEEIENQELMEKKAVEKSLIEESTLEKPRKRKSYTDDEIRMLIEQDRIGGRPARLVAARVFEMPETTADNIVSRYKKENNPIYHDRRHDPDVHEGRHIKFDDWHKEVLLDFLHINSIENNNQLKKHLNSEILRRILLNHSIKLRSDEENYYSDLDETDYLQNVMKESEFSQEMSYEYLNREIKRAGSISNWLHGLVMSLKYVIPDKLTMNNECVKNQRLEYVTKLDPLIRNENENLVIFVDEIPYYMKTAHGRCERHHIPVFRMPLISDCYVRTQVAMAVTKSHGLLCSSVYEPKPTTFMGIDGKLHKPHYRASYNIQEFHGFIHKILSTLNEQPHLISGKNIIIIVDDALKNVLQFGKVSPNPFEDSEQVELVDKLVDKLVSTTKCTITIKGAPPNSPQLNLCEYYNRTLRSYANTIRASKRVELDLSNCTAHGGKTDRRLSIFNSIIEQAIEKLEEHGVEESSTTRMFEFFSDVTKGGGFLDMAKRM